MGIGKSCWQALGRTGKVVAAVHVMSSVRYHFPWAALAPESNCKRSFLVLTALLFPLIDAAA